VYQNDSSYGALPSSITSPTTLMMKPFGNFYFVTTP
jgi:hypothetical protein